MTQTKQRCRLFSGPFLVGAVGIFVLLYGSCVAQREQAQPDPALSRKDSSSFTPKELCNIGREYNRSGNTKKAIPVLQKAVARDENIAFCWYELGLSWSRLQSLDNAKNALTKSHHLDPSNVDCSLLLGTLLDLTGKPEEALVVYRKTLASNSHPDLWNEAGNTLLILGRAKEAIEALERAHQIDPHNARIQGDLGYAYLVASQTTKACDMLTQAQMATPGQQDLLMNQAKACLADKRLPLVVHALQALIRLAPTHSKAFTLLALTYIRQFKPQQAKEVAQKAIGLDPKNAQAYFLLGISLDALGEKKEARRAYLKAVEINPGFIEAKKRLRRR